MKMFHNMQFQFTTRSCTTFIRMFFFFEKSKGGIETERVKIMRKKHYVTLEWPPWANYKCFGNVDSLKEYLANYILFQVDLETQAPGPKSMCSAHGWIYLAAGFYGVRSLQADGFCRISRLVPAGASDDLRIGIRERTLYVPRMRIPRIAPVVRRVTSDFDMYTFKYAGSYAM